MEGYISRIIAQRRLGCTKESILELLRNGVIESKRKENGGLLVFVSSLEKYMRINLLEDVSRPHLLQQKIVALNSEVARLKDILDKYHIDY